ncbi:MAG: glycosyltransferase family 9 protein [Opitutaceae bacterium]|jgi:ADP-heptose:LPS heptosyltransferase|nr:glycosyltransferase family 9 protein [Opitutaceae bacterium]
MTAAHRLRRRLARPFRGKPHLLQWLRWPNPLCPPYSQPEINLSRPGELGDVVMSLAVIREIRVRNPGARITLVTNHQMLVESHPMIDRVLSPQAAEAERLPNIIPLRYELFVPLELHVIDYLAACVGLTNIPHEIPLPDFTAEIRNGTVGYDWPRPWVVLLRQAGPFTPNKNWPEDRWEEIIRRLSRRATVIELGQGSSQSPLTERHVDLRGRTNVRQFCGWISVADLVVTPVTSAVHIAAAYRVPTLSVLGGYERPRNTAYARHVALSRSPACSPCWRREECPFDRACLREISVDEVEVHALGMLTGPSREDSVMTPRSRPHSPN